MQYCHLTYMQFQGNRYHGFRPGHPLHYTFGVAHKWCPCLYNMTLRRSMQYVKGPLVDLDGKVMQGVPLIEVRTYRK